MRQHQAALVAFFLHLVALVAAQRWAYEALDSSGVPTRDAKRRGAGWDEGFPLLMAVTPVGVVTGFAFGAASPKDHPLAETFFVLRRHPHPGLASVGGPACGPYAVDKGFEGQANQQTWGQA